MNFETNQPFLSINRIVYRSLPLNTYREKCRAASSLVFYTQGGHQFDFGNKKIEAKKGEMLYLPFGSAYTNCTISSNTEYYQFDFNFFQNGNPFALWQEARVFNQKEALEYMPIFEEIYHLYSSHDAGYHFLCTAGIHKIVGMIEKNEENKVHNNDGMKKIEKTLNHLHAYYYRNTSVKDLAKISSVSISNLEKTFRLHLGLSPLSYRNKLRIEHAKRYLAGGYSIAETAAKTGFSDVYYFSKIFKIFCKTTPGKYAKEHQMI